MQEKGEIYEILFTKRKLKKIYEFNMGLIEKRKRK